MHIVISPKQQFQETERSKEFHSMANHPALHSAITHTLATMMAIGYSADEMRAVGDFVTTLLNLTEKPEPEKRRPSKTLNYQTEQLVVKKPLSPSPENKE